MKLNGAIVPGGAHPKRSTADVLPDAQLRNLQSETQEPPTLLQAVQAVDTDGNKLLTVQIPSPEKQQLRSLQHPVPRETEDAATTGDYLRIELPDGTQIQVPQLTEDEAPPRLLNSPAEPTPTAAAAPEPEPKDDLHIELPEGLGIVLPQVNDHTPILIVKGPDGAELLRIEVPGAKPEEVAVETPAAERRMLLLENVLGLLQGQKPTRSLSKNVAPANQGLLSAVTGGAAGLLGGNTNTGGILGNPVATVSNLAENIASAAGVGPARGNGGLLGGTLERILEAPAAAAQSLLGGVGRGIL